MGRPDLARPETRLRMAQRLASFRGPPPQPEQIEALKQGECRGMFPATVSSYDRLELSFNHQFWVLLLLLLLRLFLDRRWPA